jgi:hypothetical protein
MEEFVAEIIPEMEKLILRADGSKTYLNKSSSVVMTSIDTKLKESIRYEFNEEESTSGFKCGRWRRGPLLEAELPIAAQTSPLVAAATDLGTRSYSYCYTGFCSTAGREDYGLPRPDLLSVPLLRGALNRPCRAPLWLYLRRWQCDHLCGLVFSSNPAFHALDDVVQDRSGRDRHRKRSW